MKQQRAVEYLIEQLFPKALSEEQYYHIEKAKEMEKQSLEKFYEFGLTDGYNDLFEQHYKETFKNK